MTESIYLFSNTRTIGLSIFRVVLSFLVLKNMIFYFPMAGELFGPNAIFPYGDYLILMDISGVGFLTFPFPNDLVARFFVATTAIFSVLFLFGIFKRISGLALFAMLFILKQRNGFILDGSDNVIEVTLPFLILANSYSHFNYRIPAIKKLEFYKDKFRGILDCIKSLATIALLIQICFVYFFTAFAKFQGSLWLNGTAIYYTMRVEEFRATKWNIWLTENHYFVVFSTYFTMLWELSFPFLVWFRQTRLLILILGIFLHVGIWIFMRIDNFSWIMIGSYFIFVSNAEYLKFQEFLKYRFKVLSRTT